MKCSHLLVIFLALLFRSESAVAQYIERGEVGVLYSSAQGLTAQDYYDMLEDDQGRLFISTDQGVFVVRGNQIQQFTAGDGLAGNTVFKLHQDFKGRIWAVSMSGGVSYFENEEWHKPLWNDELIDFFDYSFPYYLYVTREDNVVVRGFADSTDVLIYANISDSSLSSLPLIKVDYLTYDIFLALREEDYSVAMVSEVHRGAVRKIVYQVTPEIEQERHSGFQVDLDSSYWIPELKLHFDFYQYRNLPQTFTIPKPPRTFIPGNLASSNLELIVTRRGIFTKSNTGEAELVSVMRDAVVSASVFGDTLFVGTYETGLYALVFDADGHLEAEYLFYPEQLINKIFQDSQGSFWVVSLDAGIYKVDNWNIRSATFPQELREEMTENSLNRRNDTLIGLANHSIYRFQWSNVNNRELEILSADVLKEIDTERYRKFSRIVWEDSLAYFHSYFTIDIDANTNSLHPWHRNADIERPKNYPILGDVSDIERVSKNKSLIISKNRALEVFSDHAALVPTIPANVSIENFTSADEDFHYASSFAGVLKYIDDTLRIAFPDIPEANERIQNLETGPAGWTIASTKESGLLIFRDDTLFVLDALDYLPSNAIYFITADESRIYASTESALFVGWLDITGMSRYKFIPWDILPSVEKVENIIVEDDGIILIDDFTMYRLPFTFINRYEKQVGFYVDPASIDSSLFVLEGNTLVAQFPRGRNSFELRLHSNRNFGGDRVLWRWRLDGDDTWVYNSDGLINLTNLRGDKYELNVQFRDEFGQWTEVTQLASFEILLPMIETFWFWLLVLSPILLLSLVTIRNVLRRRSLSRELIESNMSTLKMQINPHFIFNAFNSIQYLISAKKNETAGEYLSRLAGLIRKTIERPNLHRIALNEELEYIEEFLSIEALRLDHKFKFTIGVEDEIDVNLIFIPPMLLQPILENAVWHGVSTMKTEGLVSIHVQLSKDKKALQIHLRDNGAGFPEDKWQRIVRNEDQGRSLGLKNVLERLRLLSEMHEKSYTLNLVSEKEGTHFVLTLSL